MKFASRHEKAPLSAGLLQCVRLTWLLAANYRALMWAFSRDLCRAALFLAMRPFATERSMAGTAALRADCADALSPVEIAFRTLLMALRTWERWLALCRRCFSD